MHFATAEDEHGVPSLQPTQEGVPYGRKKATASLMQKTGWQVYMLALGGKRQQVLKQARQAAVNLSRLALAPHINCLLGEPAYMVPIIGIPVWRHTELPDHLGDAT